MDEFTLEKALHGDVALGDPNPLTCKRYRAMLMTAIKESDLYDPRKKKYTDTGCRFQSNLLKLWKNFVSGSVDVYKIPPCEAISRDTAFEIFLVKDKTRNICYRPDELLKKFSYEKLKHRDDLSTAEVTKLEILLESLQNPSLEELGAQLAAYGITAPETGNPLSFPRSVHAKVEWSLKPTYPNAELYLRPEIGREFYEVVERCLQQTNNLPFTAAYCGPAYVQKITPGKADDSGSMIYEEFTVANMHYFFDPQSAFHSDFFHVENEEIILFPQTAQASGEEAIRHQLGISVSEGTISQILAFFIGKVYSFLTRIGIHEDHLRFRQRFWNEFAGYAADSWVAEIQCSYDWIECGSIAYRSSYDLQEDMEKFGVALIANGKSAEPSAVERKLVIAPNTMELGSAFEGNLKMMVDALLAMSEGEALEMKDALASGEEKEFYVPSMGISTVIHQNMVDISYELIPVERDVRPAVIESSISIDRITYCLFEHSLYRRPNPSANNPPVNVFRFPPIVAPTKCTVLPLRKGPEFAADVEIIGRSLAGVDYLSSVNGKTIYQRYVASDMLGAPFAITVVPENKVTIRDRDSREKVKVNKMEAASLVKDLIDGRLTWLDLRLKFPHVSQVY